MSRTRREFVSVMVGAAAFTYGNSIGAWQATPPRRQVTIGGRRVRVIDGHAHCVIPVQHVTKGTPLEKMGGGGGNNLLGPERLKIMDQQGVDVQALTINNFWWYAADADLAPAIVRAQNEGLAKWVAQHPDRFVATASVALQHPELAAEQLQDGVKRLGLRGASIGGHVNGEDLSLPKYDPFWSKAAELGVPVFMHPNGSENIVKEGAFRGRGELGNIIGNPLETTYFLSRLIFDGTFDKFPRLRVCAAHGGGYLPSYLGRTEVACQRPNQKCIIQKKPSEYMRSQILADTMVFTEDGLRHLVAEMGPSQVVFGTDIPFGWPVNVDYVVNHPAVSNADKEAILGGNLLKLLRMTS